MIKVKHKNKFPKLTSSLQQLLIAYSEKRSNFMVAEAKRSINVLLDYMIKNDCDDCSDIDYVENDIFEKSIQNIPKTTTRSKYTENFNKLKEKKFLYESSIGYCSDRKVTLKINQYKDIYPKVTESINKFFPKFCKNKKNTYVCHLNRGLITLLSIMSKENINKNVSLDAIDNKKLQQLIDLTAEQLIDFTHILMLKKQLTLFFCEHFKSFDAYSKRKKVTCQDGRLLTMSFFEYEETLPIFINYLSQQVRQHAVKNDRASSSELTYRLNFLVKFLLSSKMTNKDYQSFDEIDYQIHQKFKDFIIENEPKFESDKNKSKTERISRAKYHYKKTVAFIQENCTNKYWKNIKIEEPVIKVKCKNEKTTTITILKYQEKFPNLACFMRNQLILYAKTKPNSLISKVNKTSGYFIEFLIANGGIDYKSFDEINLHVFKVLKLWLTEYLKSTKTAYNSLDKFFYFICERSSLERNLLPRIPYIDGIPHEPYDNFILEQIKNEFKCYVDQIRKKEAVVLNAIKNGKIIEYKPEDAEKNYSINNFSWLIVNKFNGQMVFDRKRDSSAVIARYSSNLKKCPDLTNENNSITTFAEYYTKEQIQKFSEKGRNPAGLKNCDVTFDLNDVIKTIAESSEPLYKKHNCSKMYEIFSSLIAKRFQAKTLKFEISTKGKIAEINHIENLYSYIWPSQEEKSILVLFLALQTGWNSGPIIRADENPLSKALSENLAILEGGKIKGQQGNAALKYQKMMYSLSNQKDKYSAISLYYLLIKRTNRLKNAIKEHNVSVESEDLWLFFSSGRVGGYKEDLHGIKRPIKKWLKSKCIKFKNGEKLANIEITRCRPTWFFNKKKEVVDENLIKGFLGHSHDDTTDMNYDSHSFANRQRIMDLSDALNNIGKFIEDGTFKAILIPLRTTEAKKKGVIEGQIFTDENDRKICICKDSSNPTWEGSYAYSMQKGFVCRYLSKCTQCSQAIITIDSLPFIIERRNHLEIQKENLSELEFDVFKKELRVCNIIINNWTDKKHIEEAEIIAMDEYPLLPVDLIIPGFNDSQTISRLTNDR